MTIPTSLPYSHGALYGTGHVVRAEYSMNNQETGSLFLTYLFDFSSITHEELQSVIGVVQQALAEYAREHGLYPVTSGSLGLVPNADTPEDDDYDDYDDYEDLGFSYPGDFPA